MAGNIIMQYNFFLKYMLDTIIDTLEILMSKNIWKIFPFIFTNFSKQAWLWTWYYPAMASCFTEI